MPKQTFFNLQPDKQKRIIDASKKEFIENNFYDASINMIIKDAGISRGSFYQYFEDKEDLFIYLIDNCMSYILSEISKKAKNKNLDIFEVYILLFDIISSDSLDENYKKFITSTLSDLNIKLIKNLSKTLLSKNSPVDKRNAAVNSIVSYGNLRLTSKEFIEDIHQLLGVTTVSQLVSYFANINSLEESRNNLINRMELIKHGVLR